MSEIKKSENAKENEKFLKASNATRTKGGCKLRIANVLISNVWGDVGLDSLETGIGGREGSMIYLSREWAKQGYEVTSFVACEKSKRFEETGGPFSFFPGGRLNGHLEYRTGFHEYVPLNMTKGMLQNFPWDVVIAWECPSVFKDPIIRENAKLKICEMQVAHFQTAELRSANQYLDYVAGLSDWHCEFLIHQGLELPRDKIVTLPNGIQLDRYKTDTYGDWKNKKTKPKKNWKFVYSSSPDRGLWYLLQCWPDIRKMNPKAELKVCYGTQNWIEQVKYSHGRVAEMAIGIEELLNQPGVKDYGKIGQSQLSQWQIEADAWLYPFDPIQSTETGCITAIENAAAGNPLITTDADCMEEEFGNCAWIESLPFDVDRFVHAIDVVMHDEEEYADMQKKGYELAASRNWESIATQWARLFREEVLNGKKQTTSQSSNAAIASGVR